MRARAMTPPLLQGLTIWYRRRPPLKPQIVSLTDRSLREDEYVLITHEVSLPQLIAFFPLIPKRVGQTWAIQRAAVQAVSGKLPAEEGYDLTGTLMKVGRSRDGKSLIAEIGIEGEFDVDAGPSSFNARIYFDFEPRGVALPAGAAGGRAQGSRSRRPDLPGIAVARNFHEHARKRRSLEAADHL